MGPSMVEFLKSVYERALSVDKFDMRRQPKVVHTWNTSMVSPYWDMRLSVACAATDAEFQNRLMARDQTLNLPVMERQPHPYRPQPGAVLGATAASWTPRRRLNGPWRATATDDGSTEPTENRERASTFANAPNAFLLLAPCFTPSIIHLEFQNMYCSACCLYHYSISIPLRGG